MDQSEKREQRWSGVLALASSKVDHEITEVLTRLAYQTSVPAKGRKNEDLEEAYKTVVTKLAAGDATFDADQSVRELQILAAATLAKLVESTPDAALNVTTASFAGNRKPDLPMDLAGLAERALIQLSEKAHARSPANELRVAPQKIEFKVSAEALQSMDANLWKGQLDSLKTAANAALDKVVAGHNRALDEMARQSALNGEELQILWWLIGGYSRACNSTFVEIETMAKPLLLAREVAAMTTFSPGIASVKAILGRAGVDSAPVALSDVVNAVDQQWAESATDSSIVSPVTTPIHFALEQRVDQSSKETWQAGWSGLTGVDANVALPSIVLAELFYREHLFLFKAE